MSRDKEVGTDVEIEREDNLSTAESLIRKK